VTKGCGYTEGDKEAPMPLPITEVFADLPHPRRETWDAIAEYGRSKVDFFRRFLELPNGVPSPDTFSRVFARLDAKAFAERSGRWMAQACSATGLVPIAIDGKSCRRARKATATGCLHAVSAWATQGRLTLGQVAVEEGSNEVAAIPDLLSTLDLAGAIVTIDAAGCQKDNATIIRAAQGHYLLCVKGNRPGLLQAVQAVFARAKRAGYGGGLVRPPRRGRRRARPA
jgi:hypothetical protein